MRIVGKNVRILRTAQRLTLQQLEALTGINNGNLSKIERGAVAITEDSIARLAQALGVPSSQLFLDYGDKIQRPQDVAPTKTIDYRTFCTYKSLADLPTGVNVLISTVAITDEAECKIGADSVAAPLIFSSDELRELTSKPGDLLAIAIGDDSMAPRLFVGDDVLVDTSETDIKQGGGVYAIAYGMNLIIRRVFSSPAGLMLLSDNKDYPTMEVRSDDMHTITVVGRLKFRRGPGDF